MSSKSSPTPGSLSCDTGPSPGPLSCVCVPCRHVSSSPLCLGSKCRGKRSRSKFHLLGRLWVLHLLLSHSLTCLCVRGSAAPLSPVLNDSSGQPPLNSLLALLDVLMLFPEHMLVFWSRLSSPPDLPVSCSLASSGSPAGSSRPDFPVLSLKPHRL